MLKQYILLFITLFALSCSSVSHKKSLIYSRSYFSGWNDQDGNGFSTRHDFLKDKSLTPVGTRKNSRNNYLVTTGKWNDFYSYNFIYNSEEIDIDHLIPLKHAFETGAATWTQSKRDRFSLDSENLVITYSSTNRQKGAKSIAQWMPLKREHSCRYATQWLYLKKKYEIKISKEEIEAIKLLNCKEVKRLPKYH